jgi:small-conductance mechanosensitive channel
VGHVLRRLIRRSQTSFDDRFLASIEQELKRLVGILLLEFSVLRLTFIPNVLRTLLHNAFFLLALVMVIYIAVKLIDFGLNCYKANLSSHKRSVTDPAVVMLRNAGKILVYVTGVSIALSHFGLINNAVTIVLFAVAVVVLLSIKDIMTDFIYGFIILTGQPFRVGDAIRVSRMDERDWGWVAEIGARETRIRTRDNRILVIPNGLLGPDQVVNYMYPDPACRVQTDLHLAYETDFDQIQQIVKQATRSVEGVLADKPVEVLHWRFDRFGRVVRVYWWIASCEQDYQITTRVNGALEAALATAGTQIGYTSVELQIDNR